jgi:hypothetical protein
MAIICHHALADPGFADVGGLRQALGARAKTTGVIVHSAAPIYGSWGSSRPIRPCLHAWISQDMFVTHLELIFYRSFKHLRTKDILNSV